MHWLTDIAGALPDPALGSAIASLAGAVSGLAAVIVRELALAALQRRSSFRRLTARCLLVSEPGSGAAAPGAAATDPDPQLSLWLESIDKRNPD